MKKVNVALVGLAFGGYFSEIYKNHPNVGRLILFDVDKEREKHLADRLGITESYDCLDDILKDPDIDAIHFVTPLTMHEEQCVSALEAGKHVACTVPMGISVDGIKAIIDAKRKSGKNYMMMETTLYTYPFFYAKQMKENGEFGRIQFLRGCHYQDMLNWPSYWCGLPPMYYGTHAIAPITVLSGSKIKRVRALGSGTMNPEYYSCYGNKFPVETAFLEYENGLVAEVTRSLFETAREYKEGFSVYGSDKSFEWGFADNDPPIVTTAIAPEPGKRGGTCSEETIDLPLYAENLPESIQQYAIRGGDFDPLNPQNSWDARLGVGHHGSHPHLCNEFIRSIIEERRPEVDEMLGANITLAGILAHESAMKGGIPIDVPEF